MAGSAGVGVPSAGLAWHEAHRTGASATRVVCWSASWTDRMFLNTLAVPPPMEAVPVPFSAWHLAQLISSEVGTVHRVLARVSPAAFSTAISATW